MKYHLSSNTRKPSGLTFLSVFIALAVLSSARNSSAQDTSAQVLSAEGCTDCNPITLEQTKLLDKLANAAENPGFSKLEQAATVEDLIATVDDPDELLCACRTAGYLSYVYPHDRDDENFCNESTVKLICNSLADLAGKRQRDLKPQPISLEDAMSNAMDWVSQGDALMMGVNLKQTERDTLRMSMRADFAKNMTMCTGAKDKFITPDTIAPVSSSTNLPLVKSSNDVCKSCAIFNDNEAIQEFIDYGMYNIDLSKAQQAKAVDAEHHAKGYTWSTEYKQYIRNQRDASLRKLARIVQRIIIEARSASKKALESTAKPPKTPAAIIDKMIDTMPENYRRFPEKKPSGEMYFTASKKEDPIGAVVLDSGSQKTMLLGYTTKEKSWFQYKLYKLTDIHYYQPIGQCPSSISDLACMDALYFGNAQLKKDIAWLNALEWMYSSVSMAANFVPGGATTVNLVESLYSYTPLNSLTPGYQNQTGVLTMGVDAAVDAASIVFIGLSSLKAAKPNEYTTITGALVKIDQQMRLQEKALKAVVVTNAIGGGYGLATLGYALTTSKEPQEVVKNAGTVLALQAMFWGLVRAGKPGMNRLKAIRDQRANVGIDDLLGHQKSYEQYGSRILRLEEKYILGNSKFDVNVFGSDLSSGQPRLKYPDGVSAEIGQTWFEKIKAKMQIGHPDIAGGQILNGSTIPAELFDGIRDYVHYKYTGSLKAPLSPKINADGSRNLLFPTNQAYLDEFLNDARAAYFDGQSGKLGPLWAEVVEELASDNVKTVFVGLGPKIVNASYYPNGKPVVTLNPFGGLFDKINVRHERYIPNDPADPSKGGTWETIEFDNFKTMIHEGAHSLAGRLADGGHEFFKGQATPRNQIAGKNMMESPQTLVQELVANFFESADAMNPKGDWGHTFSISSVKYPGMIDFFLKWQYLKTGLVSLDPKTGRVQTDAGQLFWNAFTSVRYLLDNPDALKTPGTPQWSDVPSHVFKQGALKSTDPIMENH